VKRAPQTLTVARWKPPAAPLPAAAFLAVCGAPAKKPLSAADKSPPIRTIASKKQPDAAKLPIKITDPVAPDPDKALENYRKILELNPEDSVVRLEAMRRLADLQVQTDDAAGGSENSEKLLADSIRIYKQLISEAPDDANNDRLYYQLARAYQNSGQPDNAVAALTELTTKFPESRFSGDAHFRRGELLFRLGRFPEAEAEYRIVMGLKDLTPFFEPAQYKLGWSLFKQARFDDALPVFFDILDRELPPGELRDVDAAIKEVAVGKADLAKDSLRVASLAFGVMGGGKAMNDYFSRNPEPRFFPMLYSALGELFLEKRRFTDSADTFAAFIERHPQHPAAPQFQARVIAVYVDGGFNDLVVREKERYVNAYAPGAAYWKAASPSDEVMTALRTHTEDLAKHYQAKAQGIQKAAGATAEDLAAARSDFLTASSWYARTIEIFPKDPKVPELNYLQAETLEDGGKPLDAAKEFSKTAYDYPVHERAQEAAYNAVLAYYKHAESLEGSARDSATRDAVNSSLKLADTFPAHVQALPLLTRAAQDLYALKAQADAVATAQRVLAYKPAPSPEQRRIVQGVLGDSYFAQADYARAETAYSDLIKLTPAEDPARKVVVEQLAASVYKQAEAAREAGDLKAAALGFLRVGQVTPEASIRAVADYDAAAALVGLNDFKQAAQVLEGFRRRFPQDKLITEVDKKLALVYLKDGQLEPAAGAYQRIAARETETPEVRRDAAWQTAKLYDDAKRPDQAARAYEFYVGAFPTPLEPAIDARKRLAELYQAKGDVYRYLFWSRELITADENAGSKRSDRTKSIAAQAALNVGKITAADAAKIKLTLPVERSLPTRKLAVEAAIQALEKAIAYGYADVTTDATFELGKVYQAFGKDLMASERPRGLSGEELEQYNLLLEEQALPFEDKAIATHEVNLKRIGQGLYDEGIAGSVKALGELSPAKYGKREIAEDVYDSLK